MAGKLRYLDSREDEQERGITMQSSSIALKFQLSKEKDSATHTINIVDTPGHVDFSSEVSAASRLCDGALVLVDVVEGVCTQTITVLRQAWRDQLKPILVINKLDRLITELKLTTEEAYVHLARLIEQVNAVLGSFFAGQRMADDWRRREVQQTTALLRREEDQEDFLEEDEERDDDNIYFSPERGNVIFASAIDGWAFKVDSFAQLYSAKLGMKEATLRRVLWGDFFFDPKAKKVTTKRSSRGKALKPFFVQFVLDNIWAVYEAAYIHPDPQKVDKIITALKLQVLPRDLRGKDSRQLLLIILARWLPITSAIVRSIIDIVPAPHAAQATRIPRMLHPDALDEGKVLARSKVEADMFAASTAESALVCGYVSKMFAAQSRDLPRLSDAPLPDGVHDEEAPARAEGPVLLGFSRLYSGTLGVGSKVRCVLPKYDAGLGPTHPRNQQHIKQATVQALYTMMGRDLVPVKSVLAGDIFAVQGLQGIVGRSATICAPESLMAQLRDTDTPAEECLINLSATRQNVTPILRVALEPASSVDLPQLLRGLELLSQSDPCVQAFQQSTGEHVILTAGELHLERCLRDLNEQFAKIDIKVSKPIVPFRETIVPLPDSSTPAPVEIDILQGAIKMTLKASPMPSSITALIHQYSAAVSSLKILEDDEASAEIEASPESIIVPTGDIQQTSQESSGEASVEAIWQSLVKECQSYGGILSTVAKQFWMVGKADKGSGGCLFLDGRSKPALHESSGAQKEAQVILLPPDVEAEPSHRFDTHIEAGFHLGVQQGPICAEPIDGVVFILTGMIVDEDRFRADQELHSAQVASAIITGTREACHSTVLSWSPRLMLAMYSCDIQVSMDVLGKVYGVVSKRHGQILAEEIKEGTSFFDIQASLPVVESFGFTDEIRKRTSGSASPQLIFNGFKILDENPFWIPTTEEELEDLGIKADKENLAKKYMDETRVRKGLFVDRKLIEFAEKQRTLKK